MRRFKLLYLIILTFFLSFEVFASNIEINSNPDGADIYAISPTTGSKEKMGSTPFVGDMSSFFQKAGGDSFVLEVIKDGFDAYRILVPNLGKNDIVMNLNLQISADIKLVQDLDFLMNDLFDVQRLARSKDFVSALEKLAMLEKKFPNYSVIHEMKGSIFYLQNEYTRSLSSYRRAFALNSQNQDAYRMKIYLEKRFNLDPAQAKMGAN